jgi:hypothetical protein
VTGWPEVCHRDRLAGTRAPIFEPAERCTRIEALNHALRDIPNEKVRLHVCWGSFHGPHHDDIPLKDIIDLIFRVRAGSYSIEASNPCHEHEWRVFEEVKLPEGATLVPGVVGHCTDFIEHPDLVAERLVRYAKLVGRENALAGTDCGLGTRVGHPSICWAKFEAMAEGARRATEILWARLEAAPKTGRASTPQGLCHRRSQTTLSPSPGGVRKEIAKVIIVVIAEAISAGIGLSPGRT